MNRCSRVLAPLAVLGVLNLAGCQTTRAIDSAGRSAALTNARRDYFNAWTKQVGQPFSTAGLEAAFQTSDELIAFDGMSQGKTFIRGWKEYAGIWGPGMNGFTTASLSEAKPVSSWISDDLAATCSIARIQGTMLDGRTLDMPGHLTLVYRWDGSRWRIVHEHMSLGVRE